VTKDEAAFFSGDGNPGKRFDGTRSFSFSLLFSP